MAVLSAGTRMTRDRESRAFRSAAVVTAFGYAAQALSLAAIPLFLATLGAEGYGLMVTVMAFMGYLGFADAGLSWGSMILIAQAHGREGKAEIAHIVRHSAVLAVGSGTVVALVLGGIFLASSVGWRLPMFAAHPEAYRWLLVAGVQLAVTLQLGVFYNVFIGLQEAYWAGVYQGLARLLGLAGGMLAAWLTRSVEAVLLVQLGFTVVTGGAAVMHVRRRHAWAFTGGSWTDRSQYQAQIRIGAKNFLLQIGRTLSGTAPTLGISSVLGPAAVPFYTVPTTLLTIFFTPINSWNANMQSAYGEAWVAGAKDWVRGAFRQTLERALLLGGVGVVLFLSLGDTFVRLWTQDRLRIEPGAAGAVAAITVTGALLAAGQFLLTGLNRQRRAALAELANGGLALVLVPLGIHWSGLAGVGYGVVVAALATSAWMLRREIETHLGGGAFPSVVYCLKIGFTVVAGTLSALLVLKSAVEVTVPALCRLALAALTGLGVFCAVAFALRLITASALTTLRRRLTGRFSPSVP
jgi:O-antigen/teichoic acid export membrane protein